MNNNQLFDNNIKEQFRNYAPEVHPGIWDNIVNKREKRKPVGFWYSFLNGRKVLLLTVLLLATGSGAYMLLTKDNKKDTVTADVNAVKNIAPSAVTTSADNDKANTTTGNTLATTSSDPATIAKISANTTLNNTPEGSTTINDSKGSSTGSHSYSTTGKNKINIRNGSAGTDDYNSNVNNHNKKTKTGTPTATFSKDEMSAEDEAANDFYLRKILFADFQKITTGKKTATLGARAVPNVTLPGCPTFEKDAAGNKTYFEIYAGPDIALRNLSDTGNSAYLQKRKESTKFSSAFSAGLRYTRVFNNGMSIRTGINYSQINEKFTFSQGSIVQVTYIINANGDTTGSFITTGTKYKTTINKFRTIDVPILIGYEMGNGRLHANINAGLMVNVYSWQKGDVLDTSYKPVSITTGKSNSPYQFKTNIGIGFMVGTSFYYKLNDKWHLLAEPYFRYNLSPMSNEKLTLTQKYNTVGVRLGVRMDLH